MEKVGWMIKQKTAKTAVFFICFLSDYLPQLPINLEIEISLCNKKSYSQFPDLYEPVQAANVNTANNAKINFFILSPFVFFYTGIL